VPTNTSESSTHAAAVGFDRNHVAANPTTTPHAAPTVTATGIGSESDRLNSPVMVAVNGTASRNGTSAGDLTGPTG